MARCRARQPRLRKPTTIRGGRAWQTVIHSFGTASTRRGSPTYGRARPSATARRRPRTERMIGGGAPGYLGGVPMHWMKDWSTPFAYLTDHASRRRAFQRRRWPRVRGLLSWRHRRHVWPRAAARRARARAASRARLHRHAAVGGCGVASARSWPAPLQSAVLAVCLVRFV